MQAMRHSYGAARKTGHSGVITIIDYYERQSLENNAGVLPFVFACPYCRRNFAPSFCRQPCLCLWHGGNFRLSWFIPDKILFQEINTPFIPAKKKSGLNKPKSGPVTLPVSPHTFIHDHCFICLRHPGFCCPQPFRKPEDRHSYTYFA